MGVEASGGWTEAFGLDVCLAVTIAAQREHLGFCDMVTELMVSNAVLGPDFRLQVKKQNGIIRVRMF